MYVQKGMTMSTKIYVEFARRNNEPDKAKPKGFFMKPKSQRTIDDERRTLQYERRSNICTTCFTTRSLLGECAC